MDLVLAGVVMLFGCCLQGATASGLAIIASPLLALIDTRLVPVPIVLDGLVLQILISLRDRQALDLRRLGWAVAGSVPGSILGALALAGWSSRWVATGCAAAILIGVTVSVTGYTFSMARKTLATAGALSGFMGTSTGVYGPPMALLYQRSSGPEVRANLASFYLKGNLISIATLAAASQISAYQLRMSLYLVPFVLAGFVISGPARRLVDRGYVRPALLTLSAAAAVSLILDTYVW